MGYTAAAARAGPPGAGRVRPAARKCDMYLSLAGRENPRSRRGEHAAADLLSEVEELLHRAIGYGALVDPWNILGFGGRSDLSAPENSVYDQRIDELLDLVGEVCAALRADRDGGGGRRAARRRRRHVAALGGPGRLVGPLRQHGNGRRRRHLGPGDAKVAGRPRGRRGTAPGTRRAPRPATWPSRAITPRGSTPPRPTPWSSTPIWSIAIPWPPWPCWCNGSAISRAIPLVEETYSFHNLTLDSIAGGWSTAPKTGRGRGTTGPLVDDAEVFRLPGSQRRRVPASAGVRAGRRRAEAGETPEET